MNKSDWRKELNRNHYRKSQQRTISTNSTNSLIMSEQFRTDEQGRTRQQDNIAYENDVYGDKSLNSSDFSASAVRVDMGDISLTLSGNQGTTHSLKRCKTHVLVPYSRLLQIIGWRGFGRDSVYSTHCCVRFINILYVLFIVTLMLYSYVYDVISCQWKLDVIKDTKLIVPSALIPATTHAYNYTNHSGIPSIRINMTAVEIIPPGDPTDVPDVIGKCEHIISTYVIPDLLHLTAYLLGIYYFRIREIEQLYALMEKVFIKTANVQTRNISQSGLITKLRSFFLFGVFWVLLTVALQGLFVYAFGVERADTLSQLDIMQHSENRLTFLWFLFALDLLGVAISNCINIAVVLNYGTQCDLLRYYINAVGARLKERSVSLKEAMKDILSIRESLSQLNSSMARMTSLAVIRFAELSVIGLCILILNKDNNWRVWLYRSLFPAVWSIVLIVPVAQAASLNSACSKFKMHALNIRVFGYLNNSIGELDSFLHFIAITTLRAKILHITVKPSYLLGLLIFAGLTLLLLFQTGVVRSLGQIF